MSRVGEDSMTQYFERPDPDGEDAPARLIALSGPVRGVFPLSEVETSIGRRPENTIEVPLQSVSKKHCIISLVDAGQFEILDNRSTNGVFVNGRKIEVDKPVLLTNGDILSLCDVAFMFQRNVKDVVVSKEIRAIELDVHAVKEEVDRLMDLYPEVLNIRRKRG